MSRRWCSKSNYMSGTARHLRRAGRTTHILDCSSLTPDGARHCGAESPIFVSAASPPLLLWHRNARGGLGDPKNPARKRVSVLVRNPRTFLDRRRPANSLISWPFKQRVDSRR